MERGARSSKVAPPTTDARGCRPIVTVDRIAMLPRRRARIALVSSSPSAGGIPRVGHLAQTRTIAATLRALGSIWLTH